MDKEEQANFDEELREKEIKRLTSPLIFKKNKIFTRPYDIEGNEIPESQKIGAEYVLEPKQGILTDEDILKYAYKSKAAAEVRLKKGIGNFGDKKLLFRDTIFHYWFFTLVFGGMVLGMLGAFFHPIFFLILGIIILALIYYTLYVFFLKDYTSEEYKTKLPNINEKEDTININKKEEIDFIPNTNSETLKRYGKQVNDLKKLYEVKEKLAIGMIENRFSPSELTYDKFMTTMNSCSSLFYEQIESTLNIINLATEDTPKVEYEIKKRIDILKLLIEKVDELTNELVLNMNSLEKDSDEVKYLVEDMENLIESVKDYK